MSNQKVRKLVLAALFTAMSIVLINLFRFPYPFAPFLVYDPGDIPLVFAALSLGPVPALAATAVASVFQALFLSSDGWVGALMHIISTGLLVLVAGMIYRPSHTKKMMIVAAVAGTLAMTAGMVLANLTLTVWFYGTPFDTVKALIVPAIIPFNLLKAGLNSTVAVALYILTGKAISRYVE